MTTGTQIDDKLVWYSPAYPSGYYGIYQYKTWSGADRPKVAAPPPTVEYFPAQRSNGSWYMRKTVRRSKPPKRARSPENPYTCSWLTASYPWIRGYETYPDNSGQSGIDGASSAFAAIIPAPQLWGPEDDYKLIDKLRGRIAGSGFNLGVFLAEGNQALEMIANSAVRLGKAIEFTRRGNFRAAQRALVNGNGRKLKSKPDDIAGNWLEMQYGWLPLLSDMKSGAEFLAHKLNVPMQQVYKVTRTRANDTPAHFARDPDGSLGYGPGLAVSYSYTTKQIKAIVSEVDPYKLIGLTDPASVAWEKLPWSFVIDWAIPIGNYLAARGLANSVTGTFVTSTKVATYSRGLVNKDRVVITSGGESYVHSQGSFSRVISSSLDVPLPAFKPLGEIPSWRRAANAVALLTQKRSMFQSAHSDSHYE